MPLNINHSHVQDSMEAAIKSRIDDLVSITSSGDACAIWVVAAEISVIARLLTSVGEGRGHVCYSEMMSLETGDRDCFPAEFLAWGAAGFAVEQNCDPREFFTPTGWATVKKFFA